MYGISTLWQLHDHEQCHKMFQFYGSPTLPRCRPIASTKTEFHEAQTEKKNPAICGVLQFYDFTFSWCCFTFLALRFVLRLIPVESILSQLQKVVSIAQPSYTLNA